MRGEIREVRDEREEKEHASQLLTSVRVIFPCYSRPNIILNLARSVRWRYLINRWANRKYEAATFEPNQA